MKARPLIIIAPIDPEFIILCDRGYNEAIRLFTQVNDAID
jgi:hypothetical protein